MKSRAQIKSHPIHPILVSFPIGLFISTFLFNLLGLLFDSSNFHQTAGYLAVAGIGFALLAAIPGIIDYIYTVPPKSSAKKRATKHGLTNVMVVAIFSIALLLAAEDVSLLIITALQGIAVVMLSFAGWMGGTLVYRNQIGVDPRYADAGKWKELYVENAQGDIEVASSDELGVNQMKLIHANGKRIVLCKTEKGFAAFDDRCTHKGGSLAGGALICGTVQCPWHGSHFDVTNGNVKAGPAKEKINTYRVSEMNSKVYISL
ncbi:DUF2231 domain-containing protein [Chryseosolibacter indicus]|uniref:Rieske 2Fe-2S domain-containing protein n=1 Tax=Chryseosolibacter indicus TaxID=2782351 RepID=A0ABS5VQ27_9BACT|nr:DUF2231 domain-containing protein [Chryseosolibacter indicus]MBT1703241.1 Rieske 2Fe-2S domain-containing protein [Chryseosolibacter indicus]